MKLLLRAALEGSRERVCHFNVPQRPRHACAVGEVSDGQARPASFERESTLGARVANEGGYGFAGVQQGLGHGATVRARRAKHESRGRHWS